MPLTTLDDLKAFQGISSVDTTRDASLTAILAEVEAAIKKLCRPYQFEPVTLTDVILDAPWASNVLPLPVWPARSITSLYYRSDAKGDPAAFEADDELEEFEDFRLVIDDPVNAFSRSGRVERLNRSSWGVQLNRPYGRLASEPRAEPGAVKVTYTAGHTAVPEDVVLAVHLAAGLLYARRTGAPLTSASLNGASYSLAGPFTATAAVTSPDVMGLLSAYVSPVVIA